MIFCGFLGVVSIFGEFYCSICDFFGQATSSIIYTAQNVVLKTEIGEIQLKKGEKIVNVDVPIKPTFLFLPRTFGQIDQNPSVQRVILGLHDLVLECSEAVRVQLAVLALLHHALEVLVHGDLKKETKLLLSKAPERSHVKLNLTYFVMLQHGKSGNVGRTAVDFEVVLLNSMAEVIVLATPTIKQVCKPVNCFILLPRQSRHTSI